jgi:hypothetical protein
LRSRENLKKSPGSPPDGLRATWAKERGADKQ